MSEKTCFVRDSISCKYCISEAVYMCNYCKALDQPVNVCTEHAVIKEGKLYCPVCYGKLYRIEPRFVGSYRAMKKKHQNRQHKIFVKPKVHGPDERNLRITRNEL